MFYSHEILTKRGPLARVWLAATGGPTKISRRWAMEAKVDKLCHLLHSTASPMALRLKAHLLVGIARIYRRKCADVQRECAQFYAHLHPAASPARTRPRPAQPRVSADLSADGDPLSGVTAGLSGTEFVPDPQTPELRRANQTRPSSAAYRADEQAITLRDDFFWTARPDGLGIDDDFAQVPSADGVDPLGSAEMEVAFPSTDDQDSPTAHVGGDSPETDFHVSPTPLFSHFAPDPAAAMLTPTADIPNPHLSEQVSAKGKRKRRCVPFIVDVDAVLLSVEHLRQNLDVPDNILIPSYEDRPQKVARVPRQAKSPVEPLFGSLSAPIDSILSAAVRETEAGLVKLLPGKENVSDAFFMDDGYSPPAVGGFSPPDTQSPVERPEITRAPRDRLFTDITENDHDRYNSAMRIILSDRGSSNNSKPGSVPRSSTGQLDRSVSRISDPSPRKSYGSGRSVLEGVAPGLSPIVEGQELELNAYDIPEPEPLVDTGSERIMEGVGIKAYKLLTHLQRFAQSDTAALTDFASLSHGTSRSMKAQLFFSVLSLSHKGIVKVDQSATFGPIGISQGPLFSAVG